MREIHFVETFVFSLTKRRQNRVALGCPPNDSECQMGTYKRNVTACLLRGDLRGGWEMSIALLLAERGIYTLS